MEYRVFQPMHQNAIHDHFQLVHLPKLFGQPDPSLLLKVYGRSNLFYKAEQTTIVPSGSTLVYTLQIHGPNQQINLIFLIGHAYKRCFQMSILPEQLYGQLQRFPQANQKRPNP